MYWRYHINKLTELFNVILKLSVVKMVFLSLIKSLSPVTSILCVRYNVFLHN